MTLRSLKKLFLSILYIAFRFEDIRSYVSLVTSQIGEKKTRNPGRLCAKVHQILEECGEAS